MLENQNKKRFMSAAVAIFLASGLAACDSTQDAHALIAEARQYQKKGESSAAIIQLKNVLQEDPDNVEARRLLGSVYRETGDVRSAEKEIRRALELGADPADLLPALGDVLLQQGRFQAVLDEVRPTDENPDPQLLVVRGNAYLALGKTSEGGKAFERALKAAPGFAPALIGSARLALLEGNLNSAESLVDQVTTQSADNVDAWLFKGDLLRAKGEVDGAIDAYTKAIALKPNRLAPHIAIAHLLIEEKKFDAARARLEVARKHAPQSLLIAYTKALLEFSEGKYSSALASIQSVLRVMPDHMPSVLLAGAIQYALGATQQSEQHLKHFLENNPGHRYALRLLVASLLKNGEAVDAVNTLAPLLRNADQDFQLLGLAGAAYMQAGDYAKATEYFGKASALTPNAAGVRTALAMSRLAQGDSARAIAELEMAARLDAELTQADILLVMTHMRMGQYDKALVALSALEKKQPDNPLLLNLKGEIYLGRKDVRAARTIFQKALERQPEYFPAALNLARMDIQAGKPDAARSRLESLVESDQENVQAMTSLANLALLQGKQDEATRWLERANSVRSDDLNPALRLAAHYLKIGEKNKAFVLAQKLQGSHPNNPGVVDMVGQAQLANNDRASALQSYRKLVALAPASALARFRIGIVQMSMNELDAAAEAFTAALSLQPDYLDAQLALAVLSIRNGDHDRALKIARQIQQGPQKAQGYLLEGDVLMAQRKPEAALVAYESALGLAANGRTLIKVHQALAGAGRENDGQTRLSEWLKANPNDTAIRLYLASAYFNGGKNRLAIAQYESALRADPKNIGALNNLAIAYQKEQDPRALPLAEQALKAAPENPAVLDTLGWLLVEQGNLDRGLPVLQKAASLAPDQPDIRFHLAQGLLKSGQKAKARGEIERLLASNRSFPRTEDAKALLRELQ